MILISRFEKAIIANAKQNVTLDVLSYHASASLEDAQRLRVYYLINGCLSVNVRFTKTLIMNFYRPCKFHQLLHIICTIFLLMIFI